jgi:hypothetical protein
VRGIRYQTPGGVPFKTYGIVEDELIEGRTYPKTVELVHLSEGFENRIEFEHWPSDTTLPPALFSPEIASETFLARMRRHLASSPLGERIEAELEAAHERVREHDARFGAGEAR